MKRFLALDHTAEQAFVQVVHRHIRYDFGIVCRLRLVFEQRIDLVEAQFSIAVERTDEGSFAHPLASNAARLVAGRDFID